MITIHTGIDAGWLLDRVRERGNCGMLTADGAPLSTADAVAYIEAEIAKGRTSFGPCPTPRADGKCPGHQKEATA